MPVLRETPLVDVSVPRGATFREAAEVLAAHDVAAIAVVDDKRRVVGMFTDDDLLSGLFPRYLRELHHTAFLQLEAGALAARLEKTGAEPVERHMRKPMSVDVDTSAAHVVERFLHCPWGALAVVEDDRFVGMVNEIEFSRAIMRRLGGG